MAENNRAPFLGGGSHPMHSNTGTGPQTPGKSSQEGGNSGKDPGATVTGGPASAMRVSTGASNRDYAGCQAPGVSSATKDKGNEKWAYGGTTAMHGNTGSRPAQAGKSSP